MIKASFLHSGPRLVGVVRLCKIARLDSKYTDLFMKSEIRLKKSFLSYLNYCKKHNLIVKTQVRRNKYHNARFTPVYRTTEAGHQLLTILGENN